MTQHDVLTAALLCRREDPQHHPAASFRCSSPKKHCLFVEVWATTSDGLVLLFPPNKAEGLPWRTQALDEPPTEDLTVWCRHGATVIRQKWIMEGVRAGGAHHLKSMNLSSVDSAEESGAVGALGADSAGKFPLLRRHAE